MITYMTHPDHGVHIAYTQAEIAYNQKNGWKVHGPNPPKKKVIEEDEAPKKRGRPKKENISAD